MKVGIAGNGVSAVTLARRLRDRDPEARIEIFSKEPCLYYQRPKLIDLLAGECGEDDIFFFPLSWYEKNRIDIRLNEPALALDPAGKTLTSSSGEHSFDRIVIASGSTPFVPPVAGTETGGVSCLRTLDDCRALRASAGSAEHAVIIGGGVLGLEIANALRKLAPGLSVTILEVMPRLLPLQLDDEGAEVLASLLAARKIAVHTNVRVRAVTGAGRSRVVEFGDRRIPADLVIVSAGVRPELGWLRASGLGLNRGVVVNDLLETDREGIFCLGDAAEHRGCVSGIIKPAIDMAEVAAANILSPGSKEYRGSLAARTAKVLGGYILSIGEHDPRDCPDCGIIRTAVNGGYRKFVIRGNALAGFISIGPRPPEQRIQQMISSKSDVSSILDKMRSPDYNFA